MTIENAEIGSKTKTALQEMGNRAGTGKNRTVRRDLPRVTDRKKIRLNGKNTAEHFYCT